MSSQNLVPFSITSVDSLGQGVSKITDKVTFVPKTLPGEEGLARIVGEKSKVAFARLESLVKSSPCRTPSPCEHFQDCPGCHFLHTSYDYELELKLLSMKSLFRNYPELNPQVIRAGSRLGYRNRVQLHYDLTLQKIGFLNARNNQILEVPQCQIAIPEVAQVVQDFYQNKKWLKLAPKDKKKGHVEIYFHEQQLKITWNRPYAEGGFTQVHSEMNEKLKSKLLEKASHLQPRFILDLFAGDGNLSNHLPFQERLCVDMYQKPMPKEYLSLNLYGKDALKVVSQRKPASEIDLLILDPPRSGLKNLDEWLKMTKAKYIIYVSCDPHTQVRDISLLSEYQIRESFLLDLFPATFHFETMLILERIN